MSSLKGHRDVVLAPLARQDFIDPALHRRDDLPDTHLAYLVGSHLIIYRDQGTRVAVARILHQRMSIARHL